MTAKSKRWLNVVIVAAVAAVTVAALVSYVRADPSASPTVPSETEKTGTETEPPDTGGTLSGVLPTILSLPAELRKEGGLLWWAGGDCKASVLDASSGLIADAPGTTCDIWPSPDGAQAVANAAVDEPSRGRGVVLFRYPPPQGATVLDGGFPIEDTPALITRSAWHPQGESVALCIARDEGIAVHVHDNAAGTAETLPRACYASFLQDGRLAVLRGAVDIELDGRTIFGDAEAAALLPDVPPEERRYVTALSADNDRLIVGLVVRRRSAPPSSSAVAVVTPNGATEFSASLRPGTFPAVTGLVPGAQALWYLDATTDVAVILAIPGGRRVELYGTRWLTWSPSGDYVAAVTDRGIEISAWPDNRLVATLHVEADMVTWTPLPRE